jgi:hypothetical protein
MVRQRLAADADMAVRSLSRMSSNQRTKNVAGIELSPIAVSTPNEPTPTPRRLDLGQPAADFAGLRISGNRNGGVSN